MSLSYFTSYQDSRRLLGRGADRAGYVLLLAFLLLLPFGASEFVIGETTYVLIMCIASLGLMILNGYTGQISLGHAAFLGIGAYAHTWLIGHGVPLILSMAGATLLAGAVGLMLGFSAIRVSGLYLAMVTLAFSSLLMRIAGAWTLVTGGHTGTTVPEPQIAGQAIGGLLPFYFFCLVVLLAVLLATVNLLRGQQGRSFIAVRESEAGAFSLGINVTATKILAFALSAAVTGLAGTLLAHQTKYLTPEMFDMMVSFQLVLMVVIGGLGSIRGAILGAVLIGMLPSAISAMKSFLPDRLARQSGLDILVFGLVLAIFVLFEPKGLAGRWDNLRSAIESFPYTRKSAFKRAKTYMQSERYR